jgi:hypothetical protein
MTAPQRTNCEEFIAFWEDEESFSWRQVRPYVVYLGCMAIYVFVIRWIDSEGRFVLPSLIVAIGYIVFAPYFWVRRFHKRYARFIRCPYCRDWFGLDASGAYSGPNPKFRQVIETGRCGKCGELILTSDGNLNPRGEVTANQGDEQLRLDEHDHSNRIGDRNV